jgi:hypothetical protein
MVIKHEVLLAIILKLFFPSILSLINLSFQLTLYTFYKSHLDSLKFLF